MIIADEDRQDDQSLEHHRQIAFYHLTQLVGFAFAGKLGAFELFIVL
jgi:hypothetical protein